MQSGVSVTWSPGAMATLYFLLVASWRLPDPWWLISIASFLPLLPVQRTTMEANARSEAIEGMNRSYSLGNIVVVVIGGLMVLLAVLGTLLPE